MSDLLILARDYIEKMANPVYGFTINEDYSIRFARLLERDGFENLLTGEIREVHDRDALTSYGWLWLMGWAKSRSIDLSEALLLELFDEWSSVFIKCTILELATQRTENARTDRGAVRLSDFPNRFLRNVMVAAISTKRPDVPEQDPFRPEREERPFIEPLSMGRSESLLVALLQVGTPVTLDAASVLLRHECEGQEQLRAFFWVLFDALDPETRTEWRRQLGSLPERPEPPIG
jgi:hypothetical protein